MDVVRWKFIDVHSAGKAPYEYTFHINPNEGGTPTIQKNFTIQTNAGPNRGAIVQEGQSTPPELAFSGVILTQPHLEALELWFDKRILIDINDDLGRVFRGVFSRWEPQRERRAYNYWYHTFSAGFIVAGYKTASGKVRFGKFI